MKKQLISIDTNQLDTDQLEQLAAMIYNTNAGSAQTVKQINDRIAFIKGWMSEKAEIE